MAVRDNPPESKAAAEERVPRGGMHLAALVVITLVGMYFCYRVVEPFLPALAWALALAVIAFPVHNLVRRLIPNKTWSAAISTSFVVLVILIPSLLVTAQLAREAGQAGKLLKEQGENGKWREAGLRLPYGEEIVPWVEQNVDFSQTAQQVVTYMTRDAGELLKGSLWAAIQVLVTVFVLFYCFRDRDRLLEGLRGFIPLPKGETENLIKRTDDSIHATVYGTIITGLLQGVTGGLIFWALGLPAPILWGAIMFVLAILPILGAFIVWVPAAALLISQERYWHAGILVTWGLLMAGPVCNFVYAYLAGGRMRMHPVPALIAFIGGLAVFGVTGMILGPVVVVLTLELIEVWRRRAVPGPSIAQVTTTRQVENGRATALPVA